MIKSLHFSGVRAVAFDVFGTVARIGIKRSPFAKLLREFSRNGLLRSADDAAKIMTNNVGLMDAVQLLSGKISREKLQLLEQDLAEEISSIELFSDAIPAITALRTAGYKIGICSNLAAPYAVPIYKLLPFGFDAYAWSFEVGAIKPNPAIYAHLCHTLQVSPSAVLMIGDTVAADYDGPKKFGMQSLHLARNGASLCVESIQSLDEIWQDVSNS